MSRATLTAAASLAAGSLAGGFARYLTAVAVYRALGSAFPYGTFLVNMLGCFFIGLFDFLAVERYMLGPSTGSIVHEAAERGIPFVRLNDQSLVQLGYGVNQKRIEATVASIKQAVEEAELMAGCEITSVFVGVAGGHIKSLNSQGTVAIKDHEVSDLDVARVLLQVGS